MGLDMYFSARKYISQNFDAELHTELNSIVKGFHDTWNAKEIVFEVGYWRKANQIHRWFVNNVQNGVDDCREHYVSYDSIEELYNLVCKVLDDNSLAEKLLSTESGFFFGSTDYGEYYYDDLTDTKKMLEPIVIAIREKDSSIYDYEFYYRSSW